MQFKDFVSKKVLVSGLVVTAVGLGAFAGLSYRSAHSEQLHSNSNSSYNQYPKTVSSANASDGEAGNTDTSSSSNLGLSSSNGKSSTKAKSSAAGSATAIDKNCPIKGLTNSKGKKVFYLANNKGYKKAKSDVCFNTLADAVSSGYANAAAQ